ncbi:MFS transporter [Nocardia miyunensis]|uniref:MFS transporter n=1 Tax=Nocardia miyunensis TaxID=282684 RepID=UPI00082A6A5D|nr:MFS transporter [Nocardia miyunensis]
MSTSATARTTGSQDDPTGRLDGASRWRIFAVIVVIALFTEIAALQYTIVAAALPKIGRDFPEQGANISWAIIVFGLTGIFASPLLGKMSDVWGKKSFFLLCGVFFASGCLLDALTHSWWLFLVGRGLQALAVATQLIGFGLIRDLVPRRYVPLGIGIMSTGLGFSSVTAPLVGGWLVDNFDWRAIFWFLLAYVVVMEPLVALIVPDSTLRVPQRIDYLGAVLLSAGAALVLLYLDKGQDWGWGRPRALAWLIGGVLLLVAFVLIELRARVPIMDMRLLFHPKVSMVLLIVVCGSCMGAVQGYAIAYMTETPSVGQMRDLLLRQALPAIHDAAPASAIDVRLVPHYAYGNGFTLLQYGIHIALVQAVVAMIMGALAGMMARRYGARLPLILGLVIFAGCAVAFAGLGHTWPIFALVSAVYGIGFGLYYASTPILMVEAVPQEQQGISIGMFGVMQSLGGAIGPAVLTALLIANPVRAHLLVAGHDTGARPVPQVFADRAYDIGFLVAAGMCLFALVVALFMRHGRTPATGGANENSATEVGNVMQ